MSIQASARLGGRASHTIPKYNPNKNYDRQHNYLKVEINLDLNVLIRWKAKKNINLPNYEYEYIGRQAYKHAIRQAYRLCQECKCKISTKKLKPKFKAKSKSNSMSKAKSKESCIAQGDQGQGGLGQGKRDQYQGV